MKRLLAVLLALALGAPVALVAQEKRQKPRAEATKKKAKKAVQKKKRAKKAEKRSASGGQTAPAATRPPPAATDLGAEAEREEARIRRLNSERADRTGE